MDLVVRWVAAHTPSSRFLVCDSCKEPVIAARLTYLLPTDQVRAGTVDIKYVDETVKTMLRTKFALGLFESMSCVMM